MKVMASAWEEVKAPLSEGLTPQERSDKTAELSELVTKVATYVICRTLVDYGELLEDERTSIAHAFLQRVTSTHMCNHQLTAEGLVYQYQDKTFVLQEAYKTMTLTRSVYEHLVMFYFLFEHPRTEEEREEVWRYWKRTGQIMLKEEEGERKLTYSQAWKYLFENEDLSLLYRHLSMHCHPVYKGLQQYQNQSPSEEGDDWVPLYLSSCFVAYLCRLFLKQVPGGNTIAKEGFTRREQSVFNALSRVLTTS
ncbi:MAG: hypothetical protein II404_03320 [Prevotella sp.]|nr:hypothetical protein [Prevotella sp.]